MRVLVACEFSGTVRRAFRALGHDAWSCDLLPAEDNSDYHFWGDALTAIANPYQVSEEITGWDLIIAHPPCTDLAVSGAQHFAKKRADGSQQRSIDFFMACINAPCNRVAVENPVCIMSRIYRKPDQIVQPYQFGHLERKTTCLWLKNLPPLAPTSDLKAQVDALPKNKQNPLHYLPPTADRWKLRSKTYDGIAQAMAAQWGKKEQEFCIT